MNINEFNNFASEFEEVLNAPENFLDKRNELSPFLISDRLIALAKEQNPRRGAVLILLYLKENALHIPLILRPTYDGVHSGQVAFPGGEVEAHDKTQTETALREAEEEVGITANQVKVLGNLSEIYIPPSRFLVEPVVGVTSSPPDFIPDQREVEKIIEMPATLLLDDTIVSSGFVSTKTGKLKVPFFDVYGHMVWGATAIMLSELKANLKRVEKLLV